MGALINLDLTVIKISKREVSGPVGVFLDLLGHCFGEHRFCNANVLFAFTKSTVLQLPLLLVTLHCTS